MRVCTDCTSDYHFFLLRCGVLSHLMRALKWGVPHTYPSPHETSRSRHDALGPLPACLSHITLHRLSPQSSWSISGPRNQIRVCWQVRAHKPDDPIRVHHRRRPFVLLNHIVLVVCTDRTLVFSFFLRCDRLVGFCQSSVSARVGGSVPHVLHPTKHADLDTFHNLRSAGTFKFVNRL
jgi:hypothetical protein